MSELIGRLERADGDAVAGWARDLGDPDRPVELELVLDDVPIGRFVANVWRDDLAANQVGDGRFGFFIRVPGGLRRFTTRRLAVRRALDGEILNGGPIDLSADPLADGAFALDGVVQRLLDAGDSDRQAALLRMLVGRLAGMAPSARPASSGRALFVDEAVPDPNRDAGSSALLSHMRALQRRGMAVSFVPGWWPEIGIEPAGAEALAATGVTLHLPPWAGSVEEVLRAAGDTLDLVYLHRLSVMRKYAALVRRWCPSARLIYSVADLHWLRAVRQAEIAGVAVDGVGLRARESLAAADADAVITHSPFEAALLAEDLPTTRVYTVVWDAEPVPTTVDFADRAGVGFIGSYGHPPNLDAALFLLDAVMPMVWEQDPSIPLLLAGSDLPAMLRERADERVQILGALPALGELWARLRVSVAPLRFGAGLKGKVLDSLAAGIPCAASPVAAEGFDFGPPLDALVATTPAAMAQLIVRLHRDAAFNAEMAAAGLALVRDRFAPAHVDAALGAAIS